MSGGTPVDDLLAEIRRTPDLEALQRLRRTLRVQVLDSWRARPGEEPEWERIVAEVERIGRAFEERRAELQAGRLTSSCLLKRPCANVRT